MPTANQRAFNEAQQNRQRTNPSPPLRRYQQEILLAALEAAEAHRADVLTVRMARQAGKNELSARIEAALMGWHANENRTGVKAAPTQNPQAIRSLGRLERHLKSCGFRRPQLQAGGDHVILGSATWWFGSGEPGANVVGATADLLLEFDEAQDFDIEKHDKDYRPMAAATAAATIYYGTAWSDFDLLETQRQHALALQAKDHRRRVFDVTWDRVAAEVPAYGLFVEEERARLGHTAKTPHIAFRTQYELIPQAGAGRLFNPAQLALLQGEHPYLDAPQNTSHNVYVAGLDVGGANLSGAADPDETVLTIARARFPGRGQRSNAQVDIVAQYAWQGLDHDAARFQIAQLLRTWAVAHTAIDATGIGEPIAVFLQNTLGERAVTAMKVTQESKSQLGFDLIAAVNTSALKVWTPRPGGDADHSQLVSQLRTCRRELKNGKLRWSVDPSDGHDDRLFSLALALRAAERGHTRTAIARPVDR